MEKFLPIMQAVGSGAVDSVENIFINVGSNLPFVNWRRKEIDQCLNGKVTIIYMFFVSLKCQWLLHAG